MATAGQIYEQQLALQRMREGREDLRGRQQAEQAFGAAMGTLGGPQMAAGQKSMAGPEGQLWRGVAAQQQAGQLAANRRGFSSLASRAAAQGGAELESQARGQAMALREQDEAAKRAARLGLLQQRSQFDVAQAGLESQTLQQQLQQQAFEAQMKSQEEAAARAQEGAIISGALQAAGAVGGAVLKSDERMKRDIVAADSREVDALMAKLGSGGRKYVVSDEGNAAEFSGEYGSASNPKTALVYTGDRPVLPQYRAAKPSDFDAEMAAFMRSKEAEDEADRRKAVNDMYDALEDETNARAAERRALDFSRSGLMLTDIGEGGPPPEERIGYGRVIEREQFRPSVPTRPAMEIETRGFVPEQGIGPSAEERRAFTERMMRGAEEARPAAERAFASMLGAPRGARVREVATYEDAAKERRRRQLEEALGSLDVGAVGKTLEGVRPISYEYAPGAGPSGRRLGVSAQELERTPLGAGMVRETPSGKAIDVPQATGALLGMVGELGKRLRKVEGK